MCVCVLASVRIAHAPLQQRTFILNREEASKLAHRVLRDVQRPVRQMLQFIMESQQRLKQRDVNTMHEVVLFPRKVQVVQHVEPNHNIAWCCIRSLVPLARQSEREVIRRALVHTNCCVDDFVHDFGASAARAVLLRFFAGALARVARVVERHDDAVVDVEGGAAATALAYGAGDDVGVAGSAVAGAYGAYLLLGIRHVALETGVPAAGCYNISTRESSGSAHVMQGAVCRRDNVASSRTFDAGGGPVVEGE